MASVALPQMKKYNYDPALATGVVAAGGSLGILIPPSTIFIIYGILTEQSIGKLFMAGVIPGILLAAALHRDDLHLDMAQARARSRPPRKPPSGKSSPRLRASSKPSSSLPLVMGGLFVGIFTPTEAAAVGAFGTILIALVGRNLTWRGFRPGRSTRRPGSPA